MTLATFSEDYEATNVIIYCRIKEKWLGARDCYQPSNTHLASLRIDASDVEGGQSLSPSNAELSVGHRDLQTRLQYRFMF